MTTRNAAGGSERVAPDEAPELTEAFFAEGEVRLADKPIRRGRPPTGKAKRLVSLRVDQDVLQRLRALGPGWQARVNAALRAFLDRADQA